MTRPFLRRGSIIPKLTLQTSFTKSNRMADLPQYGSQSLQTSFTKSNRMADLPQYGSQSASQALDPTYETISLSSSSHISSPSALRKLLVLDLNGTLLFRPKSKPKSKSTGTNGDGPSTTLRRVHPRPYMVSFREYLFHPRTKEWLDTMVWSSAQPHSVKDMVLRSFGDREGELRGVWARDTLDLDPVAYHRKSQTIKDLTKIWTAFPSHSAETTLLADDSTRKTRLQPWNHIYVKEYGLIERRSDVACRARLSEQQQAYHAPNQDSRSRTRARTREYLSPENENENAKEGADPDSDISAISSDLSNLSFSSSASVSGRTSLDAPLQAQSTMQFDSTLLAIIGILDAVKYESNVSGWLRGGGILRCGAKAVADIEAGEASGFEAVIGDAWFDKTDIMHFWAEKGREALEGLGIEEVVGVSV